MKSPHTLVLALLLIAASPVVRAASCQAKPDATDAVAAAPENHKVILENEFVRVLEATVPKGSREPVHTHPWPAVFFEQTSGKDQPWKTVNLRWSAGGPSKGYESSPSDRHNLLIEIKNAGCKPARAAGLPDTDAVKVAAKTKDANMKVAIENEYVRVLDVKIPPGEKEQWHTHTWPAVVVYFGLPHSQRFTEGGAKTDRPAFTQMQVSFDANGQPLHSIENLGTTVYQAYRIELKPTGL